MSVCASVWVCAPPPPPPPAHTQEWCGSYKVPASRLASASHAEVQVAFKGSSGPHTAERWDNNGGGNWQVGKRGEGVYVCGRGMRAMAGRQV